MNGGRQKQMKWKHKQQTAIHEKKNETTEERQCIYSVYETLGECEREKTRAQAHFVHIDRQYSGAATQLRHYIAVIAFFHGARFSAFGSQISYKRHGKKMRSRNNNHRHIYKLNTKP